VTGSSAGGEGQDRFGGALARVKAQRAAIVDRESLTLRVPDYEDLQIRYRLMPEKDSEEVGRKMESAQRSGASGKTIMGIAADFLVSACDAILVRVGDKFEVLVDDVEQKIRFDARLAEVLAINGVDEAREIVLETFSPEGEDGLRRNPDAIIDHLNAIGAWRKGRVHEIDQSLLGE
jgi:hypothetical protein